MFESRITFLSLDLLSKFYGWAIQQLLWNCHSWQTWKFEGIKHYTIDIEVYEIWKSILLFVYNDAGIIEMTLKSSHGILDDDHVD